MPSPRLRYFLFALLVLPLTACGDACGDPVSSQPADADWQLDTSDAASATMIACPNGESAPGVCAPEEPRGLSSKESCPSGQFTRPPRFRGEGICLPELANWGCPEGWTSEEAFGDAEGTPETIEDMEPFAVCRPSKPPENCPPGQMPVLGKAECIRQGLACPSGDARFHDVNTIRNRAPSFRRKILYVDPQATDGGDGSREAPFKTISTALEEATESNIVALAPGTYREAVEMQAPVALVGACSEKTRIASPDQSEQRATLEVHIGGGVRVSDVTLEGRRPGIWVWRTEASSHFEAVTLEGAEFAGLIVAGQNIRATASRLLVRGTRPQQKSRRLGRGVLVTGGARLTLEESTIEGNHDSGLFAELNRTRVILRDAIIRGTKERPGDSVRGELPESGLKVTSGAKVVLRRAWLADNRSSGTYIKGGDTEVEFTHAVLRGTRPTAEGKRGWGGWAGAGAEVTFSQSMIEDNAGYGFRVTGMDTLMTLQNSVVRTSVGPGSGIDARDGAILKTRGLLLDRNDDLGIALSGSTTRGDLRDVVSRQAKSVGLQMRDEAEAEVQRLLLESNGRAGLFAHGNSTVDIEDLVARNNGKAAGSEPGGRGLAVEGATLEATRVELSLNRGVGLAAFSEADVTLNDAAIWLIRPQGRERALGWGAAVRDHARLTLNRAVVDRNRRVGLNVGPLARGTFNDLRLTDTRPIDQDGEESDGDGLLVARNSVVALTRGLVAGHARHGLVCDRANLQLEDVHTHGNQTGLLEVGGANVDLARTRLTDNAEDRRSCEDCGEWPTPPRPLLP